MSCGAPAHYTQRLTHSHEQIEIGAAGMYEARCRYCFEPPEEESVSAEDGKSKAEGNGA